MLPLTIYINIESLRCTPETNTMFYVKSISIENRNKIKEHSHLDIYIYGKDISIVTLNTEPALSLT